MLEVVESRESERDMATDTMAGVMFDVGDVKNIFGDCVGMMKNIGER